MFLPTVFLGLFGAVPLKLILLIPEFLVILARGTRVASELRFSYLFGLSSLKSSFP
jgi:hypothetical protein